MKFKNARDQTAPMIELVCLILSMGAIFLQIWILFSSLESFFQGQYRHLWAHLVLSGVALVGCGGMAWLTGFSFFKRING